jgi:hypothetical protein
MPANASKSLIGVDQGRIALLALSNRSAVMLMRRPWSSNWKVAEADTPP